MFYGWFSPTSLEIQAVSATVTITQLKYQSNLLIDATTLQEQARTNKIYDKVDRMNDYIEAEGLIWQAGITDLVSMHYNDKKELYNTSIWCPGYEYYESGIFCMKAPGSLWACTVNYDYVSQFDWRNRHGANDPASDYWDGSNDGSGWVTGASCQNGCFKDDNSEPVNCDISEWECNYPGYVWRGEGTCWIFGPTSYLEAMVNLYLNKHVDVDLAEQEVYSCLDNIVMPPNVSALSKPYEYFKQNGVINEESFPYMAEPLPCQHATPNERINIASYEEHVDLTDDEVRNILINNGPVSAALINSHNGELSHSMELVGWDVIQWDDSGIEGLPTGPAAYNYIGYSYWIYKENHGDRDDRHGFRYIIHPEDVAPRFIHVIPTDAADFVSSQMNTFSEIDIECKDEDNDGYFTWGLGPKPAHCPPCPDEPDGDDNNASLGPLDSKGFCKIIGDFNWGFEDKYNEWKQEENDDCDWYKWFDSSPSETSGPKCDLPGQSCTPDGSIYYMLFYAGACQTFGGAYIESPPIEITNTCSYDLTFAYHKNSENWDNDDISLLSLDVSYDNGQTWQDGYWSIDGEQGETWHYVTVTIPSEVNKLRFYGYSGAIDYEHDIAIDDITLTPITNPDIIVSSDDAWSNPNYYICGDITVETGAELTLDNTTLTMSEGKHIFVEPGARLIVDGTTITSLTHWGGIQVWGDNTANQFPDVNGDYNQGYLKVENESTIKNAILAVDLWKPDDYTKTGGIFYASNSWFVNNVISIHALEYRNYLPGNPSMETEYAGNVKDCIFQLSGDYPTQINFAKHVDLANVKGLDFQGCIFYGSSTLEYMEDETHAIYAYNASFKVTDYCSSSIVPCPSNDTEHCRFSNFYAAINAVNDASSNATFYVNNAEFLSNVFGVRNIGVNNSTVTSSKFWLAARTECAYGIYAEYATGFAYEENEFNLSNNHIPADYFGIALKETNGVDEIYKNTFNGLSYANYAEGKNYIVDITTGLAYFCNTNSSNYADFYVEGNALEGIQSQQGSILKAAGNSFTGNSSTREFYNGAGYDINYYTISTQMPHKTYEVNIYSNATLNSCPSHYGGGTGIVLDAAQKSSTGNEYYYALTDYNNVKTLYDNYMDGGNTSQEINDIQTAQPQDMWSLRAQLLGDSPHLSFDVLKEAADRTDVFTDQALFDILAANPDELKKDTLISYLENKEDPLPDYMISILEQMAYGSTYKTTLLRDMGMYAHDYSKSAHDLIRSNLNDTAINKVELRNWLDNLGGISSDYQIISSYMSEGNYTDALSLANMLPGLYELTGEELTEHDYYLEMIALYKDLYNSNRKVYQMTEAEKTDVQYIAANSDGIAGNMAKAIMEGAFALYDINCIEVDGTAGYKNANNVISLNTMQLEGMSISVKPNPASVYATFDYTLPMDCKKGLISITSGTGKTIQVFELNTTEGQIDWDIREVSSGVYYYRLESSGLIKTGKIVVE